MENRVKFMISVALCGALASVPVINAQPFAIDEVRVTEHTNDYILRAKVSTTARYTANIALTGMAAYMVYRLAEAGWYKFVNPLPAVVVAEQEMAALLPLFKTDIALLKEQIATEGFFAWCKTQAGHLGLSVVMNLASTQIISQLLKPHDAQYLFGTRLHWSRTVAVHDGNNKIIQREGWEGITHSNAHTHVPEILKRIKGITELMVKSEERGDDAAYYHELFIANQKMLLEDLQEIIGFLYFEREQSAQYRVTELEPAHIIKEANMFFNSLDAIDKDVADQSKAISYAMVIEHFEREIDLVIQGCLMADAQ